MQSNTAITRQLAFGSIVLVTFLCSGCGPSGADAVKFANQRISKLKAQEPKLIQGDEGKWYSEAIEIRNANPGFKQDGAMQSMDSYDYRMLRSAEFDTEAEASAADLSLVDEEWQTKEELFTFKNQEWTPIDAE